MVGRACAVVHVPLLGHARMGQADGAAQVVHAPHRLLDLVVFDRSLCEDTSNQH
jgi:hypothetical protein